MKMESPRSLLAQVGRDAFPRGGTLSCAKCKTSRPFTSTEAGRYLADGWPRCSCGESMTVTAAHQRGEASR